MAQLITTDTRRALIGIGVTGLSVARHLCARGQDFDVFDTRDSVPSQEAFSQEFPEVRVYTGAIAPQQLSGYREVILSPGIDSQSDWFKQAIGPETEVLGDIDLFAREANAPIVAITGSNAKSTVTTLLGEMAKEAGRNVGVGGNLGPAALELLAPERDLYVLELSSFQLELVRNFSAEVACILNLSPDHMDRYPSMMAYHAAKQRIYMGAKQLVFNRDDALTQPLIQEGQTATDFGLGTPDLNQYGLVYRDGKTYLAKGHDDIMPAAELQVQGRHNFSNVLAAFALGEMIGLSHEAMRTAARAFPGLPHRCELVANAEGVVWINDSKATNVGAVKAALTGFGDESRKNIVLIAGGQAKGQRFSELVPMFKKWVKQLILIGEDADQFAKELSGAAAVVQAMDMDSAVQTAAQVAEKGDTVLLSPACASFDMFRGYEHRGQAFVHAVNQSLQGLAAQGGQA